MTGNTNLTDEKIDSQALTVTHVANNGMTSNTTGINAYKAGKTLVCNFSIAPIGHTATSDFIKVATISGWNANMNAAMTVPQQNDATKTLTILITTTGDVMFYTSTGILGQNTRACICTVAK